MSTQKLTNNKAMNRALATVLALLLTLGILPVVVLAGEVSYHTQGGDLIIYLDTSDEVVTEDSVTDYYYNIIKTNQVADQDLIFKIALGKAPGINNQSAILHGGKVKVYTSNAFSNPFYTVPDSAIVSVKNNSWPEAGYAAGRNGMTHTITIPANTFAPGTTYYMMVDDVSSSGGQGDGSIGKRTVFRFTTAPAGTVAHVCTSFVHHDAKAGSGCTDGYEEYWQCTDSACGKLYSDANGKNEITRPVPIMAPHRFETIYAKDATCTEIGYNVVGGNGYNHCLDCGRYFKNNGAELLKSEVEIPALGHNFVGGVCTRCGANETGGTTSLTATLTADKSPIYENESITLTATAKGGTSPYTYKFIVHNTQTDQWYKIRDFASGNSTTWYSGAAGPKTLYVDVKDAKGTVVRQELAATVRLKTVEELRVTTFESSKGTSLTEKNETTLRATASGGVSPYTYKFIVYNNGTKEWYKIRDFESSSTTNWFSGAAGSKVLYVDVKDARGTVVRKELSVTVSGSSQTPLTASYFTSSKGTALNPKDTTNLVAKAAGGSGSGYTYKFIVYNKGTGDWYKIQDYSTKSSCSWYTGSAGNKILYVDIKDSAGNYVRTPLNVTVK